MAFNPFHILFKKLNKIIISKTEQCTSEKFEKKKRSCRRNLGALEKNVQRFFIRNTQIRPPRFSRLQLELNEIYFLKIAVRKFVKAIYLN